MKVRIYRHFIYKATTVYHRVKTSKGGLIIYVDDQYKSKVTFNLNTYEHWEGLIVKVQGHSQSKTFTTGNIYRSPRTRNEDLNVFIDTFTPVISRLDNCNNAIIIAGDFNINLLKINENDMFSSFFSTVISHSLYPQINLPTKFTRTTGTLIDNLFCRLHKPILKNTRNIN